MRDRFRLGTATQVRRLALLSAWLALAARPALADVSDPGTMLIGGQGQVVGTMTVTGNAFSVGGSTLAVSSGRLGISSGTPTEALVVGGESSNVRRVIRMSNGYANPALTTDTAGEKIVMYRSAAVKTAMGFGPANDIWFQTNSGDRNMTWYGGQAPEEPFEVMRFNHASTLGLKIGQNSFQPAATLDVYGNFQWGSGVTRSTGAASGTLTVASVFTTTASLAGGNVAAIHNTFDGGNGLEVSAGSPGSTADWILKLEDRTHNDRLRVLANGKVGVGASAPATKLDVGGDAQFGSGVAKSTFSAAGALTLADGANLTLTGTTGTGLMLPQYTLAQLKATAPAAAGVLVMGPSPTYDLYVGTGTAVDQWLNMRTQVGP